jgi:rhodanese-related sulfurtransferase
MKKHTPLTRFFYLILLALCLPLMVHAQTYTYNGAKWNLIIDVRTPEEFASGHIDGAINIPYDQIEAKLPGLKKVEKEDNILVYCRSGRRSETAKETLNKLGYKNVQNGGGMADLTPKLRACKTDAC